MRDALALLCQPHEKLLFAPTAGVGTDFDRAGKIVRGDELVDHRPTKPDDIFHLIEAEEAIGLSRGRDVATRERNRGVHMGKVREGGRGSVSSTRRITS